MDREGFTINPDEQAKDYNSRFAKGVQFGVGLTSLGMLFITSKENLSFNLDKTIDWAATISAFTTEFQDGKAVAHAFSEVDTGKEERLKQIAFVRSVLGEYFKTKG